MSDTGGPAAPGASGASLDLTPRTGPDSGPHGEQQHGDNRPPRRRRKPMAIALIVVVLFGLGFVVVQGLNNAVTYYYNVDEAVKHKADIGDRRFRVQGMVTRRLDDKPQPDGTVRFTISFNGYDIDVVHTGDPPELFKVGIPVVLEGRWQGARFASDKMLIKHSSEYKAENPDRVSKSSP